MDYRYLEAIDLERSDASRGWAQLQTLLAESDPLAFLEVGFRYVATPEQRPGGYFPGVNESLSQQLVAAGKAKLLALADEGDGEAMRMLGYLHLDFFGRYGGSRAEAEAWLLRAVDAGCYFVANDLHMFYCGQDDEKARYWLDVASQHNCRVIHCGQYHG